jgi:glycosyltransferase involved in cell wall biosynthesis
MKIAVFGPGPVFKGGIANFSVSLAKALAIYSKANVSFFSWISQYPAIIPRAFKDEVSKQNPFENTSIKPLYVLDFNKPLTWYSTAQKIARENPDLLIIQWAIALQGLPLYVMIKRFKKCCPNCIIIFDVHNVVQKESSSVDRYFTRLALGKANKFIMHGELTVNEFRNFFPEWEITVGHDQFDFSNERKEILCLFHPNYDLFDVNGAFNPNAFKASLGLKGFVFMFFGFIRKYKGLHYAIEAFASFSKKYPDSSLLIAGELFWAKAHEKNFLQSIQNIIFKSVKRIFLGKAADESNYNPLEMIKKFGIEDKVVVINTFIPNEEVHQYFKVADAVLNLYEYATPSGIESIAYQFGVQLVATPAGHFNNAIKDGVNGYLSKSFEIQHIIDAMEKAFLNPVGRNDIIDYGKQFSWKNYANAIIKGVK